ncbi:MAG: cupin domain-containing protein [Planctomycetota bacterium]
MTSTAKRSIETAQVVVPCSELEPTLAFFTERLAFRVDTISPADDPSVAVISGYGVRLRLERGGVGAAGVLRLACSEPASVASGVTELVAPNGTRVELVSAAPAIELPPLRPSFVLNRMHAGAHFGAGRAGMSYRDLIPDRQGGRFIASHIRIPRGGPVSDYVHFHEARFQWIYCYTGWVRVVYEDQGPPFVLQAGDAVLQPPRIRHRVLECSSGLEVIELASPARHDTCADHELSLPTPERRPDRDFGGQRFTRHEAARADWQPWRVPGFECRDMQVGVATDGLAGARVVRPVGTPTPHAVRHDAELLFLFVLEGTATLEREQGTAERIGAADAIVIPAGMRHAIGRCSADLELLEVSLPAELRSP